MSRTIEDWVARAHIETSPEEVGRCLDAAAALASTCAEWQRLLLPMAAMDPVLRDRLEAVAKATLESASAEQTVWGFRRVAEVRATRLGDSDGARAALEAGVVALRAPHSGVRGRWASLTGKQSFPRGYEWVILGEGFVETLTDTDGFGRCLDAGLARARADGRASDIVAVAGSWAKNGHPAAAAALLSEAETCAGATAQDAWTIANGWSEAGDRAAARRVLNAALTKSRTCSEALIIMRAWASHREPDEARKALGRAEELAVNATDWLEVGEAAFDGGLEEELVRAALARASALANDEEVRARVAQAYKGWLHDDAAADRAGPRGVPPDALRRRVRTLDGWASSASALFDWLRARVTPEVLTTIANADYMDAEKHYAALADICETGLVPRRLGWEPHEALALTRWSSGERVDHLERALSCTLLCLAPWGEDELVTNGPILVESCLALGSEPAALAEQLFAWRAETMAPESEEGDYEPEERIALMLLVILRAAANPEDARLDAISLKLAPPDGEEATVAELIAGSMKSDLWAELMERYLRPLEDTNPVLARRLLGT